MFWLQGQRVAFREIRPELLLQGYMLMIALNVGLGGVIAGGGDKRFSNPSFKGARDLVSWSGANPRLAWGALFFVLGILLVWAVGKRSAVHFLRFGLVVHLFLVVTFVRSAFQSPAAALTGIVIYLVCGGLHLVLAAHIDKHGWR